MKISLGHSASLDLSVDINLMLNPRMLQMLKVLNMPYAELIERIKNETEENPLIEVEKRDLMIEYLRYHSSTPLKEPSLSSPSQKDRSDLETYIKKGTTLEDHLLAQTELLDISNEKKELLSELISRMDENGYVYDWNGICKQIGEETGATQDEIEEALRLLQGFEPDGVGARSLKECLLIQIEAYDFDSPRLMEILKKAVSCHLEEIASKDTATLSKTLDISEEASLQIVDFIKENLTPHPGSLFSASSTPAIPSFSVKTDREGVKLVNLELKYGPEIKLSPQYLKMLEDPGTDKKTVSYIKEKLEKANELMEQLQKRRETLEKIASEIVERQLDYLEGKALFPLPLLQKDLSDKFGVHPSTVSRALSEKYIETKKGVISLRSLCPKAIQGSTSAMLMEKVRKLIMEEDPKTPLTDEQVRARLLEEGFDIKRRTITDYRNKLFISSFAERKKGKK